MQREEGEARLAAWAAGEAWWKEREDKAAADRVERSLLH
jgi:hypothetical protein